MQVIDLICTSVVGLLITSMLVECRFEAFMWLSTNWHNWSPYPCIHPGGNRGKRSEISQQCSALAGVYCYTVDVYQ